MRKSEAINVLKLQKEKLINDTYFTDQNWFIQTTHYIKIIFGEQSEQYKFISCSPSFHASVY